ncbi:Uncharacterised protein [Vibrio cholerae]|nr:Uncharacterised protein [Vibrio cholerae]
MVLRVQTRLLFGNGAIRCGRFIDRRVIAINRVERIDGAEAVVI